VESEDDIKALVEHAVSHYGKLDVAFNNAGIEGLIAPLAEQTDDNYRSVMDINVRGVWLSMKHQIPEMLKAGGGAIVNNSSVAGMIGFGGIGIYSASKHAVMGLTKCAALEYSAQGIRVNAVNPAVIETSMVDRLADSLGTEKEALGALHPIGRIGQPDEVANAVLWLCSGKASFVTGVGLPVDGAYTAQ
jgi:NAD(P)-dependent dehydrogenase (short-subunit alcohol dehydrogenase family)